jgi:hypothetical protein
MIVMSLDREMITADKWKKGEGARDDTQSDDEEFILENHQPRNHRKSLLWEVCVAAPFGGAEVFGGDVGEL